MNWRRAAGMAFAITALVFLAGFIAANVRELRQHDWTVRPGLLALSVLIQAAGLASGVLAWQLLLRRMGVSVGFTRLARVKFVSGLARYIPGKIWPFIGAARLGVGLGMTPAVTVTSLAAHTGFALVAALLTAALFVPFEAVAVGIRLELLRWTAPAFLLLAHPRAVGVILAVVRKLTKQDVARWSGTWLDGLGLLGVACVGWLVTGVGLYTFTASLTPIPASALAPVIGINALAFVAGQAVFIAPAGLGAKEGSITALLTLYLAAPVAAVIAIGVRLWTTLAELLLVALFARWPDRA